MLSVLRYLKLAEPAIPGVEYYDEYSVVSEDGRKYQGFLRNVRLDTAPKSLIDAYAPGSAKPGPEEVPYTWFERIGLAPVHPSRVRARQFYHPITDFAMYDYDDPTPEEVDLTAKWMAKVMEFNMTVPFSVMCGTACVVLPLHTAYRMPLLMAAAISGIFAEGCRSYLAASKERQDLDDFIMAKEIWHIKNVEVYQAQIPRMPVGKEHLFTQYLDPDSLDGNPTGASIVPQEVKNLIRI